MWAGSKHYLRPSHHGTEQLLTPRHSSSDYRTAQLQWRLHQLHRQVCRSRVSRTTFLALKIQISTPRNRSVTVGAADIMSGRMSVTATPRTKSSHARAPGIEELLGTFSVGSRVCSAFPHELYHHVCTAPAVLDAGPVSVSALKQT